ncbi:unnamed protein product [Macrosiphum euphorbiae]|uniref:HAT C-terminal dimerisation domain-containing protein n=1 Tax=Macrosiphum euphorbiae TaxID=13131 RepID=A0AAV0WZR2_9HEMI|nr:unnamed protein product [Macrosiphum euphorbiae]
MDILLATSIVTKTINSIRKLRANNSFEEIIKLTDNFINESDTDFIPLKNIRPRRVPIKAGELMQDDPIVCPIKKFEVETYNAVIDMTLNELSDRFETTNIGPLKDIALLSYRRIQELHNDPTMLPKDSFIELCEVYSKINRDCLISEYMQFCKNLNEFENNLNLPKFLHDVSNNKSSKYDEDENDNNDDNISMLELNTYDDLNETSNDNDQRAIKNIGSTKKIFQMFCTANLTSCFPNLYVALKLSVTLPISSCSVERSFSKLKLIKTKLRTSMLQDRLENLMKISCEKDLNPIVDNIILSLAGKSSSLCKALVY